MKIARFVPVLAVLALALLGAPVRAGALGAGPMIANVPVAKIHDLGRAPMAAPVHLAVVFAYRNEAELEALLDSMGDPTSPLYGRTLTPAQFSAEFGPTPAQYAAVARMLAARGMQVEQTFANRTVLDVVGPAAAVERAFSTELHRAQYEGRSGYVNVRRAYLPRELSPAVYGVVGFDSVESLHAFNHRGTARPAAIGPPLQGPDTGYGPFAFAAAYDMPVQHGRNGKGQSTGIVIDADYKDADLAAYLKYFKIARTGPATVRIPVDGGPSPAINPDSVETSIDTEAIVGIAPGTSLYEYEMSSLLYKTTIDGYDKVVSDNLVGAVNSSFGGCETYTSPSTFPQMSDHIAAQGAALGIVFSAATGDAGTYECTFPGPGGVSTPASGPHFVAVGATTLFVQPNGAYRLELGWAGSGGGFSARFPRPKYQQGVAGMARTTRNVPDVAFDGDPSSGLALRYLGAWVGPYGGTSLATPIFTALSTELAQQAKHRLGASIHQSIYGAFKTYGYTLESGAALFHDVTFGNNGYYGAHEGYDQVTGIGSIDGWDFATTAKLQAAPAGIPAAREYAVALKLRNFDTLERLISSQSDPSSPLYHRFLSVAQFRDAFAPTAAQYAATVAALRRAGLQIVRTDDGRTSIDVRGAATAAAAAGALPGVLTLVGDGDALFHTPTEGMRPAAQRGAGAANGPDGGFGPTALVAATDFPVTHGATGAGVTVADVIDGHPAVRDLKAFDAFFHTARKSFTVKVVPVDGGKGGDVLQADLDSEWIAAAAPGASQIDYEVPLLSAKAAFDAYKQVVAENRADVVNTSWGACESSIVTLSLALQNVYAQGAAQGIAFEGVQFGQPCGGWVEPLPMSPGDSAYGFAVGGSYVAENAQGKIVAQTALVGSNGGVSIFYPVPAQQKVIPGVSPLGRNAPDLVIPATVNGAGSSFYSGGAWDGGSAFVNNAPAAGLLATYQQMTRKRLGAFDRTLYTIFAKKKYAGGIFTDITLGCNGSFANAALCAKTGYDLSTGIGSLDAYALGTLL